MADEPLIQRVNTLNLKGPIKPLNLRRVASGYLVPGSLGFMSNVRVHSNDTTITVLNNPSTPRPVSSPGFISNLSVHSNDTTITLLNNLTTTRPVLTPRSSNNATTPQSMSTFLPESINHDISFRRSNSSPAIYTDEKGKLNLDDLIPRRSRKLTSPHFMKFTLLGLFLYFIVGITVFTIASQSFTGAKTHKVIDAIYFTILTLTTIGYGDIVPDTTFTKLFTCLFILVGFGFVGTLLNELVTYVLDRQEDVILGAVDQNKFIKMIEVYVFDRKKGRLRIRIKMCLALGVVILSLVLGTVTAHYIEGLDWVDSFYVSVTSVTTVGYGDNAFKTSGGRCFAIVWLLISTLAVARAFMYLVEYRIEKRNRRRANMVLEKKLTLGDLVAADLNRDGSISKAEYVVYKLKEMGKIGEKLISKICEQFDTMESPDHTRISIADLKAAENSNRGQKAALPSSGIKII